MPADNLNVSVVDMIKIFENNGLKNNGLKNNGIKKNFKKGNHVTNMTVFDNDDKPVARYTGLIDEQGIFNDDNAKIKYSNGDIYLGNYFCGLRHGKGVYKTSNGFTFDGEWVCGIFMEGKKTFAAGYSVIGKFKNWEPSGKCIQEFNNGMCYKVIYKNNIIVNIKKI